MENSTKLKKQNQPSLGKKIRDWWVKGFQMQNCYLDDWDEMDATFKSFGLDLSEHGPIITMNELKFVRSAKELTEALIVNPKIRKLASIGITVESENNLKGRIFLIVLRLLPEYCKNLGEKRFEKWVYEANGDLARVFDLRGTQKEIDSAISEIIRNQ